MSYLTRENLRELYVDRGHTMAEIGRRYGCSKQYVSVLCARYGVDSRGLRQLSDDAAPGSDDHAEKPEDLPVR